MWPPRGVLTCRVLPSETVDGSPLGLGLQQEQEHGLQDAGRVTQGERPHQPALGGGPNGPVRAAQAVQHHEQGPAVGRGVADAYCQGAQDTLGELHPGGWTCGPRQMRTTRSTLLPARVTVAVLLLSC